jgi:hypothetical protein
MSSLPGGLAGLGTGQQLLQGIAGPLGNRPARRCLPAGLGRASPAASIAQVYCATEEVAVGKKISCEEAQEQAGTNTRSTLNRRIEGFSVPKKWHKGMASPNPKGRPKRARHKGSTRKPFVFCATLRTSRLMIHVGRLVPTEA